MILIWILSTCLLKRIAIIKNRIVCALLIGSSWRLARQCKRIIIFVSRWRCNRRNLIRYLFFDTLIFIFNWFLLFYFANEAFMKAPFHSANILLIFEFDFYLLSIVLYNFHSNIQDKLVITINVNIHVFSIDCILPSILDLRRFVIRMCIWLRRLHLFYNFF